MKKAVTKAAPKKNRLGLKKKKLWSLKPRVSSIVFSPHFPYGAVARSSTSHTPFSLRYLGSSAQRADLIAPIDHHVGKWLKDKMKKRYCAALSEHWETWRDSSQNDSLAAPKRRMMMAGWLDDAMNELKDPKMASFLYASFDSTGVLVKRDGTHNIKIRGGKDYKFP